MPKGQAGRAVCNTDGCGRFCVGWGLCGLHYARAKRSGSVTPSHRSQARAETIGDDGRRKCWKCGERKPFDADHFPHDRRRPGELKGTCRECLRRAAKNSTIVALYGITLADSEALLAAQGGKCAVCRMPLNGTSKNDTPHIDHCHDTSAVRGVLCHHCNVLLGHAKDSSQLLREAAAYLERSYANP
jgi:hypothetical protein